MAPDEKNAEFSQADLPELLTQYYQRLFPYKEFYRWLSYGNGKNYNFFMTKGLAFPLSGTEAVVLYIICRISLFAR